ncbi:FAD-dependent monooxygenase [Paraburkholderia dipogonis]|uniref:FAD-dependent monooxygenase n=1 Tax=Paraburkholderia dipogonis TaxID=1211383 RepID=UPI00141AB5AE|nr:FAD-dependent oxidoreductase [Paraburkholderia dipogonis]
MSTDDLNSEDLLKRYKVPGQNIFLIGTFDAGVTVLDQQVRALNLVWALVEQDFLQYHRQSNVAGPAGRPQRVAIVGGGFAGLTAAAGLLRKGINADITLFEQRDTLLPLQQGSDSRWLHPHIYDWPKVGSLSGAALLPVLNWTAARASDVVVQILGEWKATYREWHGTSENKFRLYCNARHVQVHETGTDRNQLRIEWVGEQRSPEDGITAVPLNGSPSATYHTVTTGSSEEFDIVLLAVGFGTERDTEQSYWRNETYAQPSLDSQRHTYVVSGQGDGAMMDLLRLRVSQFRQDRILGEIFEGKKQLVDALQEIQALHTGLNAAPGLFNALEVLSDRHPDEFATVRDRMSRRLRRDTEVILSLQVKKFSELFDPATRRISFQNRVLVYLLYKCGGFFPSSRGTDELERDSELIAERVVRRHGTRRDEMLKDVLSEYLYKLISSARTEKDANYFLQPHAPAWRGGYFGFPGRELDAVHLPETTKSSWKKEYLPGPTALMATAFCASLSGVLAAGHSSDFRLRVVLHRVVSFGGREVLQQACDYQGVALSHADKSGVARTFPTHVGTIGLAFGTRQIIRSRKKVSPTELRLYMKSPARALNEASRDMSPSVTFVLAIPIVEPPEPNRHTPPSSVVGVIYIDSQQPGYFINNKVLSGIVTMADGFVSGLQVLSESRLQRLSNMAPPVLFAPNKIVAETNSHPLFDATAKRLLEEVTSIVPPMTGGPFQMNFDYSEFVALE